MKSPLLSNPPEATRSEMAIAGHPIHAMLISFPIAFLLGGLGSDIAYWWTNNPFWATASLWQIGVGLALGCFAGLIGMLDFMLVKEIRQHIASWSHFLAAVVLLTLAAANWWSRVVDAEASVLPWGLFLSAVTAFSLALTGWYGGKLVFDHKIGTKEEQ
jgi:uncharacterized membrane protein